MNIKQLIDIVYGNGQTAATGGHRKAAKQFPEGGRAAGVRHLLDAHAIKNGWKEV